MKLGVDRTEAAPVRQAEIVSVDKTMRHYIENLTYMLEQAADQLFCGGVEIEQLKKWQEEAEEGWKVDDEIVYTICTRFEWQDGAGNVIGGISNGGWPPDAKFFVILSESWGGKFAHLNPKAPTLDVT